VSYLVIEFVHEMNANTSSPSTAATSAGNPQNLPKEKYRSLKRKFKFLVYENECYQEELRNLQRRLLKLSRDKNFLLDRLMQYEKVSDSSDDSDPPAPTVKTTSESPKPKKQKKSYPSKKSRAKQQAGQPNLSEGAPQQSTMQIPGAAANAATIRSRPKKGNANGASSSSDVEVVASTSGTTNMMGAVIEIDRAPTHVVQHYPPMGVFEHLPPPSGPNIE